MSIRSLALPALAALLCAGLAHAAPTGEEKWQITTKMEMVGMPFAMPGTTATVCLPPGEKSNEKMVPADSKCKVSGMKVTGNTTRFHVECPPPEKMSGDGEFTRLGADAYNGTMSMKGVMDGESIDMKMTYAGKKIGMCDSVKDKMISAAGIMAEQQKLTAQSCAEAAKSMAWQHVDMFAATCPTLKADICKTAKTTIDAPKTSDAVLDMQEKRGDWKELAGYCGMNVATLNTKYCALAKKEQNWNNAALICGKDAELEALAKKECTGKMYSGAKLDAKWKSLCALYADQIDPGVDPNARSAKPTLIENGARAVEGLKTLRGLFGK